MHILGAIAEFERERIRERVMAGLQWARTQGKRLGSRTLQFLWSVFSGLAVSP